MKVTESFGAARSHSRTDRFGDRWHIGPEVTVSQPENSRSSEGTADAKGDMENVAEEHGESETHAKAAEAIAPSMVRERVDNAFM